ncbi:winged helix-turn-helix transcriptional regulator [Pseudonocardia spinosispora]|uniref:winged helix-turn-helix transcriptional regulator n=1 Tax=Pseudonocardia spinosispora TaxID=103441 RepID=UPI00041335C2|nr:helix-turn-helix domain-containing protein [Pseudonocardia spinosispora]
MSERGVSHRRAECPVARTVDVIGDRWSLLIVRDVLDGIGRFSELQRSLGLAKNILATRLRDLVAQDILELVPAADGTAYQAYALTRKGRDLFAVMVALRQWGETYLFDEDEPHSVLLDNATQRPVKLHVTDAHDRPITADDAFVRKVPTS